MTTTPQLDERRALLRIILIAAVPVVSIVAIAGILVWLQGVLDPWWFQTDACPQDPNLSCGQPAPVLFLLGAPLLLLAGGIGLVGRWRADEQE